MTDTSPHVERSHGRSVHNPRYGICLDALIHRLGGQPGPEIRPLRIERIHCGHASGPSLTARDRPGTRSIARSPSPQVQTRAASKRAPSTRCTSAQDRRRRDQAG
jgi:hypothetical protein